MIGLAIKTVSEFFGLHWLRIALTSAGVLLVVSSCVARDNRLKAEGAAANQVKIVKASEDHGNKAYEASKKAVAASRKPGAAERLRASRDTCTDC